MTAIFASHDDVIRDITITRRQWLGLASPSSPFYSFIAFDRP